MVVFPWFSQRTSLTYSGWLSKNCYHVWYKITIFDGEIPMKSPFLMVKQGLMVTAVVFNLSHSSQCISVICYLKTLGFLNNPSPARANRCFRNAVNFAAKKNCNFHDFSCSPTGYFYEKSWELGIRQRLFLWFVKGPADKSSWFRQSSCELGYHPDHLVQKDVSTLPETPKKVSVDRINPMSNGEEKGFLLGKCQFWMVQSCSIAIWTSALGKCLNDV